MNLIWRQIRMKYDAWLLKWVERKLAAWEWVREELKER